MKLCRVVIRGGVQGVGYRAWTQRAALARGLAGWVRNRSDGAVEALFAGEADLVAQMLAECRLGPPAAQVVGVEELEVSTAGLELRHPGEQFSLLPTT
ncbi:MAG: acylphosphatase [Hyphomicrobiales bacterium]|nr:acylphosphatase [Hyphomicrobiales bacterium]